MSEGALRAEPRPAGPPVLERIAASILERGLTHLEGGTLVVTLPDGTVRRFGSGPAVEMTIRSSRLFRRIATRGAIGLGESYMAEEWDTHDPVALFELLLQNTRAAEARHPTLRRVMDAPPRPNRRNGPLRSRRNIAYHYDLGNELFQLMLDPTMTYSCAVFDDADEPLEDAQRRKLRQVCDKLGLGPDDRVLEIGCGWGGFAMVAAEEYGAHVTGLTISRAQATLARERISAAGLDDRIEIREEDYRSHRGGPYTKVASIEMLEAIGEKQFGTYFATIDRLLAPGGRACIQTILVPDDRWDRYRKSPDWIERYVFPGCLIPSLGALATASARSSNLMIHEVEEIGPSYAETLKRWREAFIGKIEQVRELGYDRRFERTWIFYLSYCEAAFRLRALRDVQLTFCRSYGA
jgi:cyclopropane-fatty-acyl-phospholipid synthase